MVSSSVMESSNEHEVLLIGLGIKSFDEEFKSMLFSSVDTCVNNNAPIVSHLNLHCNDIEHLHGLADIPNISHLVSLNLSSNNIRNVCLPELTWLSNLVALDLSSNNISSLESLPFSTSITSFTITHNCLSNLFGIENFPCLIELDIRSNLLQFPSDFIPLSTLDCLSSLHIANTDGTMSNPMRSTPANVKEVFAYSESLTCIDRRDRIDWLVDADVCVLQTPKFDRISKRFHQLQHSSAAAVATIEVQTQTVEDSDSNVQPSVVPTLAPSHSPIAVLQPSNTAQIEYAADDVTIPLAVIAAVRVHVVLERWLCKSRYQSIAQAFSCLRSRSFQQQLASLTSLYEDRLSSLESTHRAELQAFESTSEEQIMRLRSENATLSLELSGRGTARDWEGELSASERSLQQERVRCAGLMRRACVLEAETGGLKAALAQSHSRMTAMEEEVARASEGEAASQAVLKALQDKVALMEEHERCGDEERRQLAAALACKDDEISVKTSSESLLQSSLASVQTSLSRAEELVSHWRGFSDSLKQVVGDRDYALAEARRTIEASRADATVLRESCVASENKCSLLANEVSALTRQAAESAARERALHEDMSARDASLVQTRSELRAEKSKLEDVCHTLSTLQTVVGEYKVDKTKQKARVDALVAELLVYEQRARTVHVMTVDTATQCSMLNPNESNKKLEEYEYLMEKKLSKIQSDSTAHIEKLSRTISDLHMHVRIKETMLDDQNVCIKESERAMRALEHDKTQLCRQLERCEAELEAAAFDLEDMQEQVC